MVSHPHCVDEVREGEVLLAKDSPTVPDGEEYVVPGKDVRQHRSVSAGPNLPGVLSLSSCARGTGSRPDE